VSSTLLSQTPQAPPLLSGEPRCPAAKFTPRPAWKAIAARALGAWLCLTGGFLSWAGDSPAAARIDFNRDIRPILSENCYACHGPDKAKRKAGLRLDLKDEALRKLESGDFAIVPGQPDQSKLLKLIALRPSDDDHMPPKATGKQLTRAQAELLRRWISQGAKWAGHWAYTAPERPPLPAVKRRAWPRNEIDRFILARLEQAGLAPNPEADRYALIRRLSLDLTGLPPTVAEADEFAHDRNPRAYENLVERLLSSPHSGERLALAWLDQARYADTSGYHFDGFRQMHLWRDWVIQAFNENKPFDQFTIEQLAGDLLPDATVDQKIATGFHRNVMTNDEGGADPDEYLAKYMVDRVSTTAQVWLGTTLGCAECHDHKFDPISAREFYQFYAFFHNVPEKGLDGTRVRNPAPVMKVPSADQGAQLVASLEQIQAAEKTLSEREAELPKKQSDWEKETREKGAPLPVVTGWSLAFPLDDSIAPLATGATNTPTSSPAEGEPAERDRTWVTGKIGRALSLAATNDFFESPRAPQFEHTNAFSYGGWIKLHGKTGAVLSKMEDGPGFRGVDLLINEGKVEVHLVHRFPENAIKVVTKDPLPTNVWQHVFMTYDGSQKAAGVRVYVDGRRRTVEAPNDKLSASLIAAAPLRIGARTNAFPFRGWLDDIRFYDRALAPEEVDNLVAEPELRVAALAPEARTEEQQADLKRFFREHRATEFIAASDRLRRLRQDREALLGRIPDTMVMQELEKTRDTFVLVRGNFQQKGEKVSPNTPACWPPLPDGQPANRLALARWLVATNNPLTARVIVNRYWAMIFGTGLVKTSNDFGSQGDRPTHPELLDWLACEFMRPAATGGSGSGTATARAWDVRHLLRLLVTSAAYRQSGVVGPEKLARDPYNRLVSRGPRVRLEAELIRDNALAASGLLNSQIGGPSVKPYQPPGIWDVTDHKYEQSKGPDLYRRGLYVFWKRAAHYPSFQTFDAPSRETCTLVRPRTSTPLQSLVVMNDPVYVEAARALAEVALSEGGPTLAQQLTLAFRRTLARPPQKDELALLRRTYEQQHQNFVRHPDAAQALLNVGESPRPKELGAPELAAMTCVANVLLNLNETITK
jgi:hypothetical protein